MAEAVLLIFITVINLVLWAVFIIRFKKTFSPSILLSDIKNEVDKLLIEINRTVDEDLNLIESRRESLRELLQTVDKRLFLLQKETSSREREETVLQKLSPRKKPRIDLQETESQTLFPGEDPFSEERPGRTSGISSESGGYSPPVSGDGIQLAIDFDAYRINPEDSGPEILNETPGEAEKEIPLRDQALQLHAQGLSVDLISRKLKLPVSAVQMIIDTFGDA